MSALSRHQHKLPWAVFFEKETEQHSLPYQREIKMRKPIMNDLPNEIASGLHKDTM